MNLYGYEQRKKRVLREIEEEQNKKSPSSMRIKRLEEGKARLSHKIRQLKNEGEKKRDATTRPKRFRRTAVKGRRRLNAKRK